MLADLRRSSQAAGARSTRHAGGAAPPLAADRRAPRAGQLPAAPSAAPRALATHAPLCFSSPNGRGMARAAATAPVSVARGLRRSGALRVRLAVRRPPSLNISPSALQRGESSCRPLSRLQPAQLGRSGRARGGGGSAAAGRGRR